MKCGDNVTMKSFVASGEDWSVTYGKLKEGKKYVFLFLGAASADDPIDPNAALNSFGWVFDPERANTIADVTKDAPDDH
jgi:hypothetical protein